MVFIIAFYGSLGSFKRFFSHMHLKLALRKILCANNCKKSFTPFSRQRLHPTLDFLIKKSCCHLLPSNKYAQKWRGRWWVGGRRRIWFIYGPREQVFPLGFFVASSKKKKVFSLLRLSPAIFPFFPLRRQHMAPFPPQKKRRREKTPK